MHTRKTKKNTIVLNFKQNIIKKRKIGKVSYVSIFNSPEQERLFAQSAKGTMSKEAKLKW